VAQGSKISGLCSSPGMSELAQMYGKNQALELGFLGPGPGACHHLLCVITNIEGTARDQSLKLHLSVGLWHGVQCVCVCVCVREREREKGPVYKLIPKSRLYYEQILTLVREGAMLPKALV
jgi:hypothetical protein